MVEPIILPKLSGGEPATSKNALRAFTLFAMVAVVVLAVERWATHSPRFLMLPGELGSFAVTFDLAIAAPILYWIVVVRGSRVPAVTIVPVISLGLFAAGALLPDGHRDFTHWGRLAVVPAELAFGWWAIQRARLALRRSAMQRHSGDAHTDFFGHLRGALREAVRIPALADAVAFEIAVLYYALFSWRALPHVPGGAHPFTIHKKSGVVGLLVAGILMTFVETSVVHLLVQRWSVTAAWIITTLSVYGALWILGFLQAIRLRPILLTERSMQIRLGMISSVDVPYGEIASIARAKYPFPDRRAPGYLRAMLVGDLQFLIELRAPVKSEAAYGRTRSVSLIGVSVDEPAEFLRMLEAGVQKGSSTGLAPVRTDG